jgi:hypothetical protein
MIMQMKIAAMPAPIPTIVPLPIDITSTESTLRPWCGHRAGRRRG